MKIVTVQSSWPHTLGGYVGRLQCWWSGKHRRGKRIASPATLQGSASFECPRCGSTWSRPERKRATPA